MRKRNDPLGRGVGEGLGPAGARTIPKRLIHQEACTVF